MSHALPKFFLNPSECSNLPGHHEDPNFGGVSCVKSNFRIPPEVPLKQTCGKNPGILLVMVLGVHSLPETNRVSL